MECRWREETEQHENKQGADEMTEENMGVGLFSTGSINLISFAAKLDHSRKLM